MSQETPTLDEIKREQIEEQTARAIIQSIKHARYKIKMDKLSMVEDLERQINNDFSASLQRATSALINERMYAIDQLNNLLKGLEATYTDGIPF